jgi:hypothetical protein
MNKTVLLVVIAIAGTGCFIRHEDGSDFFDEPSSSETRSCSAHNECKAGCFCDTGARRCRTSQTCTIDAVCPTGFRCDGRGSCVPRDEHPAFDGRAADARTVTPDAGAPASPDALASCDAAAMGSGTCAPRCRFDQQCGAGARCLDGHCERACTSAVSCGTGAVCRDGFCQPDQQAGGQCVYASQCAPAGPCINGYCHPGCARDGDCPNRADVCDRGVCRPDERPLPPCTGSAQCGPRLSCVDGLCRLGCGCDADCAPWGAGTLCAQGFCVAPQELSAAVKR